MSNNPTSMTEIPTEPPVGTISQDYSGSYQEWEEMVIRDYINRWLADQPIGDYRYGDSSIGSPNQADKQTGLISYSTYIYFRNWVQKGFALKDPWGRATYGTPPTRNATYIEDPNSDAALLREENESEERIAREERESLERIKAQEDATNRWIAEGEWGLARFLDEQEGERFRLQLEFNEKELAQSAIAEANRHRESMVSLALEVAKYDAELAASPRNWLKYAAWLKSRDVVINGMTLSMAAQEVPDDQMTPQMVTSVSGSTLAGAQVQQELISGLSGGSASGIDPFGTDTTEMLSTRWEDPLATGAAGSSSPYSVDYLETADPATLAYQLLGSNPYAAGADEANPENLQNIWNGLMNQQGQYGQWGGPTGNEALGIDLGDQVSGQKVDYRKFSDLLDTEKMMTLGGVESVRGEAGVKDWLDEMERARPKGGTASVASWG